MIYIFIYWPDWALVPLVQRPKVVAFANFIRLVIFLLTAFWLSEPSVVVCLVWGSGPKEDGSVKFGLEHQPDLRGRSSEAVVVWRRTPARRVDVGENCSGRSNGFKLKFLFQVSFFSRLSTTSIMDCQLLRQRGSQKISVIKVNTFVFVVFKTKHELECQNELFL